MCGGTGKPRSGGSRRFRVSSRFFAKAAAREIWTNTAGEGDTQAGLGSAEPADSFGGGKSVGKSENPADSQEPAVRPAVRNGSAPARAPRRRRTTGGGRR
jgi:hypothetical protein